MSGKEKYNSHYIHVIVFKVTTPVICNNMSPFSVTALILIYCFVAFLLSLRHLYIIELRVNVII